MLHSHFYFLFLQDFIGIGNNVIDIAAQHKMVSQATSVYIIIKPC